MGEGGARRLLRLCLRTWPAGLRERHGPSVLETSLRLVAEARARGRLAALRELAGEAGALLREGAAFRLRDARAGWEALGDALGAGWGSDLRFTLRTLGRSPGFTLVAVSTLALGIGGSAAIFSLVDGVLLREPPYERPYELVLVWNTRPASDDRIPVSGPDAAVLDERARTLSGVAFTMRGLDGSLEADPGGAARHIRLTAVTRDFFPTLGVSAALGRVFDPELAPGEAPLAALLSHRLWRTAFQGDPAIVGREVRVNGRAVPVVGVLPRDFAVALPPGAGLVADMDVWLPLTVPLEELHRTDGRLLDQDSDNTGAVVARLAPGATLAEARGEADRIAAELRSELPSYAEAGLGFAVRRLTDDATAHARPVLLPLLAGILVVLLVVTLNLATLLLARGMRRGPELAVRRALGAGRLRILRQLLVESAVLVGGGLAGGLLLARGALAAAGGRVPPELLPATGLTLDGGALAFAGGLAGVVALLCGLASGTVRGRGPARVGSGRGVPRGASRGAGRKALVVAQVGFSVALVLGAGLLLRTVDSLRAVDPGFRARGALTFKLSLRIPDSYRSPGDRAALMRRVEAAVGELPGVEAVGLMGVLPLEERRWTRPFGLPGEAESEWHRNRADFRQVTSGVFDALGTRIVEGRGFTPQEDAVEEERVVLVDRTLARRIAPDGTAVDAVLGIPLDGSPVEARVVGVVETIRYDRLDADGRGAVYVPYRQEAARDVSFVVRSSGDPRSLAGPVRSAVQALDPRLPVHAVRTLEDYLDDALAPRRFALALLLGFAALALLCAAVGLYGVVAYDVGRRRRAIGVRLAVGATGRDVVRAVLASGLRLALPGLALGVVLGVAAGRGLQGLVFGVAVADPTLWAAVLALVLGVTLLATWLPARRASRLDPTEALRAD